MRYASLSVTTLFLTVNAHMQHSVLTRQSGHSVQPRQVCLTVFCVHTHPVQGLASPRTLDHNNPVIVFNLGKGRLIMHTHPVDDGRVWSHMSDVLLNNEAACEIAAVQHEVMEYFTTAFMAHLAYGHCGDAAMQLIAQVPELYGDVLANDHVRGMRGQCEGCHLAGRGNATRGCTRAS